MYKTKRQILTSLLILGLTAPFIMGNDGCGDQSQANREKAAENRADVMSRAQEAQPVPNVNNFVNRKAVAEYMKRMDDPNKTFYVYITSMTGKVMGYYVTRTHPISICSLMTPPDQEVDSHGTDLVMSAPTLNGLYANGADGCDHYYAFTADSDTLIEFSQDFFIADHPLTLEADRLQSKNTEEPEEKPQDN